MAGLQGLIKARAHTGGKPADPPSPPRIRLILGGISLVLFAIFLGGSALLYRHSLHAPTTIPGILLANHRLGALGDHDLDAAISRVNADLQRKTMTLTLGKHALVVPLSRLGTQIDTAATREELQRVGKSGDFFTDLLQRVRARRGRLSVPLALRLDTARARSYLVDLKARVDRPAAKARLDLEKRTVVTGHPGYRLRIYDALATIETALRAGKFRVVLPVTITSPAGNERLKGLDIGHVLAHFSTVYSLADDAKDRAHNLKVGASKLDGRVLAPGERLSYNETVGPRTKAQGYRTAHVISQGELVDGMAGGSCQISSTLFAASFFAGLELVSSRPHSIPSGYIKMGLDATVAYPTTDLVIRNPYDFPIAIHFKVAQGRVSVQILGLKRPYRRVEFRRVIKEKTPFKEIPRKDPAIPRGVRVVTQRGIPGFRLERQRLFYVPGKKVPVRTEKRELRYPPTTQYVHVGSGPPNPNFKLPRQRPPFGDVKPEFSLSQ